MGSLSFLLAFLIANLGESTVWIEVDLSQLSESSTHLTVALSDEEGSWTRCLEYPECLSATLDDACPVIVPRGGDGALRALDPTGELWLRYTEPVVTPYATRSVSGRLDGAVPPSLTCFFSIGGRLELSGHSICRTHDGRFECRIPLQARGYLLRDPQADVSAFLCLDDAGARLDQVIRLLKDGVLSFSVESELEGPLRGGELIAAIQHGCSGVVLPLDLDNRTVDQRIAVPSGESTLWVSARGYLREAFEVVVAPGGATDLGVLTLGRPARLEVLIDPELDPFGEPWRINIFSKDQEGWLVTDEPATAGSWRHRRIGPGEYLLKIQDDRGDPWYSENLELAKDDVSLRVTIEATRVEGSVRSGSQTISQATLRFGGRYGSVAATLGTDIHGEFSGLVPTDALGSIFVLVEESNIERNISKPSYEWMGDHHARLDIELGQCVVKGVVLSEEGLPAEGAKVTVRSSGHEKITKFADAGGRFSFNALSCTRTVLEGTDETRSSPPYELEFGSQRAVDVTLVLEEEDELVCSVLLGGEPARGGGAVVGVPMPYGAGFGVFEAQLDATGTFRASVGDSVPLLSLLLRTTAGIHLRGLDPRVPDRCWIDLMPASGGVEVRGAPEVLANGGAALRRDGAEVNLFSVAHFAEGQIVRSQDDGAGAITVSVPSLEVGEYSICWSQPNGSCQSFHVAAGSVTSVQIP